MSGSKSPERANAAGQKRHHTSVDLTTHPDEGRLVDHQIVGSRYADDVVLAASAALDAERGRRN
ncbi:hypothetical protein [Halohasta litchfieldiae]|uniref:hypothetical protein n=1 Tax=Halohasta litchfieldiae TaxID=1073996 RepID=UPI000B7E00AA|nr:hypothetical protein [Halohasta litchfieldiae]